MRIANTPSVVCFTLTKQDKWKLEQALGKGDYRITVIAKDRFKVIGRDPRFKPRYGDGFNKLCRANKKRESKTYRVVINNMPREMLGDFYTATEATMTLKQDKNGNYMELVVDTEKIPFRPRAERKDKTAEEKMQQAPIAQGDDGTITLDKLFAARRLINEVKHRFRDQMILSVDDNGELKFMVDAELTEKIRAGLISQSAPVQGNHSPTLDPGPGPDKPADTVETVNGHDQGKPGFLGLFKRGGEKPQRVNGHG